MRKLHRQAAKIAKERNSFTAKDAKGTKENNSLTAKDTKVAKGLINRIKGNGRFYLLIFLGVLCALGGKAFLFLRALPTLR